MKKIISLLCVLILTVGILAIGVVSAAADVPATELNLKSGDKVSYSLALSDVPNKIVGCDFSVYYDSSMLTLNSVADFNDNTNDEDWTATINPDLDGEVRGNWSILRGVDFSKKRNIVTLNLTAKKDGTAHISYFVRYMYDDTVFDSDDRPQIDQYLFTCDVTVNGKEVLEDAQPELNVEEEQPNGLFVNSRTGDSDDADAALSGDSIKQNGGAADGAGSSGSSSSGGSSSGSGGDSRTAATDKDGKSIDSNIQSASEGADGSDTDTGNTVQTDADGKIVKAADSTADSTAANGGSSPVTWIIIGMVVLIACGLIAYVIVKNRKAPKEL